MGPQRDDRSTFTPLHPGSTQDNPGDSSDRFNYLRSWMHRQMLQGGQYPCLHMEDFDRVIPAHFEAPVPATGQDAWSVEFIRGFEHA